MIQFTITIDCGSGRVFSETFDTLEQLYAYRDWFKRYQWPSFTTVVTVNRQCEVTRY